jgi:hypothetical protein
VHSPWDEAPGNASLLARAWWLHPFLLAAFPVLFLFAANIREQITLEPLIWPLAFAIAGAGVLLLAVAGIARARRQRLSRAGLVASVLVILFFSYGHVWQVMEETLRLHRYLLGAWVAIGLIGITLVWRARLENVQRVTLGVNVASIILVGLNLLPIAQFGLTSGTAEPARADPAATASGAPDRPQRDVWYIVFDRYAGSDALSQIYGYDNQAFHEELEQRGFVVAEHSTANYLKTAHSLASTLNMDYLDADALAEAAAAPDDWSPLYRALQGSHAVERFLHDRGYRYLHLGVRRGATYTNSEADRVFLDGDQTEFSAVLADTTLLVALENVAADDAPGGIAGLYGHQTLYQFNTLEMLARARGDAPRFIFAHFLLPHPPYVFNADGSWVTPGQAASRTARAQYLEQVQFANERVLRLLDAALDRPEAESPIVLIQADEGPFPVQYARDEEGFAWTEASDDELLEKFSILAAYRIPGMDPEELGIYPSITPVNSFRLIFNAAFGTDLPMLPDRNWVFVDQRHIYEMVDLTDRVARSR